MASETALRGPQRAARAGVFGASAVGLATAAHVAGGGSVPSVPVLALLAVPVAWVSVVLTRGRRGPVSIGATLLATQAALHEALMAASGMACAPTAGTEAMAGMAGMPPGPVMQCTGTASPAALALPASTMTAAHLVATALTALVLARGERLLVSVAALVRHATWALRLGVPAGHVPAVHAVHADAPLWVPSVRTLVGANPRRGPPRLLPAESA